MQDSIEGKIIHLIGKTLICLAEHDMRARVRYFCDHIANKFLHFLRNSTRYLTCIESQLLSVKI